MHHGRLAGSIGYGEQLIEVAGLILTGDMGTMHLQKDKSITATLFIREDQVLHFSAGICMKEQTQNTERIC